MAVAQLDSLGVTAMIVSFTFWLVVLAVLISYLCVSVSLHRRQERRAEEARMRALFPPRAFDSSPIAPHIELVRQDHAGSAQRRWRPAHYRTELFAAARRLITGLAYFRRARRQHELHKHDA